MIIHVRGATFCLLMSLLFFVFLLFASYGIWCDFFHGMLAPILEVVVERCFLDFLCWSDAGFVGGRKESTW